MTGPNMVRAPRIKRECEHKYAKHVHGTPTAYKLDRCRCDQCTAASTAEERRRRLDAHIGAAPSRICADPVREHIRALQAEGLGYRRVAALAGLSPSTVLKIVRRDPQRADGMPQQRIAPETARRILAVQATLDTISDGGVIDAAGTLRRLHALHARGWSRRSVANRLGVGPNTLAYVERAGTASGRVARAVRDIYEVLWDAEPPSETSQDRAACSRTIRWAREMGWAPPAAFDDEEIDDPRGDVDAKARRRSGLTRWDSFETRFWGRIDKNGPDGCWLWTGPLTAKGYGQDVQDQKRSASPHRWAYELLVSEIPEGLVLDHLCRVRHCCNPVHLEPVTPLENTRRGADASWVEPCPSGHPPEHRRTQSSGKTICSECRRKNDRARDRRDREKRRAASRARYAAKRADRMEVAA